MFPEEAGSAAGCTRASVFNAVDDDNYNIQVLALVAGTDAGANSVGSDGQLHHDAESHFPLPRSTQQPKQLAPNDSNSLCPRHPTITVPTPISHPTVNHTLSWAADSAIAPVTVVRQLRKIAMYI